MTQPDKTYTREQLRAACFMSAGAAAGIFMRAQPHAVMPSEDISEAVESILAEFYPGAEQRAPYLIPKAE